MFGRDKKQLPVGAKRATRRRNTGRGTTGTGVDEGYLLGGVFYLLDGSATSTSDYCQPAQVDTSTSTSGSGSSYGDSGYGSGSGSSYSGGGSSYDGGSSYSGGSSSSSSDSGSGSSDSGSSY